MLSPRLERLVQELQTQGVEVAVHHHTFALAPGPEDLVRMFGSLDAAKREILEHWRHAAQHDEAGRIRPDLMAQRPFPYPHSTPALLACAAASVLAGEVGHGRYFSRAQRAHLTECHNIADRTVLLALAEECGFDRGAFAAAMDGPEATRVLSADQELARRLGIHAVPTLVVDGRWRVTGAVPYDRLREAFLRFLSD